MLIAPEPCVLHCLAGSDTVAALDATKARLDAGLNNVNEREPEYYLSPLHIAAAFNNLPMCQLLLHYGAELESSDRHGRKPLNFASGKCRKFLKKHRGRLLHKEHKFSKVFSFLFGRKNCLEPNADASMLSPFQPAARKSCPAIVPLKSPEPIQFFHPQNGCNILTPGGSRKTSVSSYETAAEGDPEKPEIANGQPAQCARRSGDSDETGYETATPQRLIVETTPKRYRKPSFSRVTVRSRVRDSYDHDPYITSDNITIYGEASWLAPQNAFGKNQENRRVSFVGDGEVPEELSAPSEVLSPEEKELCEELSHLQIDHLRRKLKEKKISIGPIDQQNRKFYEKRLVKREMEDKENAKSPLNTEKFKLSNCSIALRAMIKDDDNCTMETRRMGLKEENLIKIAFSCSRPQSEVSYFCYLLIDPTMIMSADCCSFGEFIASIFYVGKGNKMRPMYHLERAKKLRQDKIACKSDGLLVKDGESEKFRKILELWDRDHGVILLSVNHHIHSDEALIREACMIEAIGLDNLTNMISGININKKFPDSKVWTKREIAELGALNLRRAYKIFPNEVCRPIKEADVIIDNHYPFHAKRRQ